MALRLLKICQSCFPGWLVRFADGVGMGLDTNCMRGGIAASVVLLVSLILVKTNIFPWNEIP